MLAVMISGNNSTNNRDCIDHILHVIDGKSGAKLRAYQFFFKPIHSSYLISAIPFNRILCALN